MRCLWLILAAAMLLSGCGTGAWRWNPPPARSLGSAGSSYVVQRGDTLYSIAFRFGLDFHDLAAWNGIDSSYTIYPGQQLRLSPPVMARRGSPVAPAGAVQAQSRPRPDDDGPPSSAIIWVWPAAGRLLSTFQDNGTLAKGINIGGAPGEDVRAAADGKVVYVGSGLIGYGQLIIVKHNGDLLSAYAHNQQVFVREGDEVARGDRIATMGEGRDNRAELHFEIRYDGKPVDPLRYLPRR